ncbi:FAD-dependent monooxygenase [Botrimarina sp.]|uniref:NAD(P)/FAD-dependent oxidoreductase n=1 Tax=Botrimarina sp. TaxID=2795802 RepID=UPI0032EC2DEB
MTQPAHNPEKPPAEHWPAVVVGAGVAGATVACLLAAAGLRVLLVEAKRFPRDKVCGACLNRRALAALAHAGLEPVLSTLGGAPTTHLDLRAAGRALSVPTPEGLALTRRTLDTALLAEAQRRGVAVRQGVRAAVLPTTASGYRPVRLTPDEGEPTVVAAAVVIAADGLGAPSVSGLPDFRPRAEQASRIGAGATLADESIPNLQSGSVLMAVGPAGYVGVVRCEQGKVNAAAAFDARPAARSSLGELALATLRAAGVPAADSVARAPWRGVRRLTQAAGRVAGERLLVVGDSAGYVEPFTGEGMACAAEDALRAAPLAARAATGWEPAIDADWTGYCTASRRDRQRDIRRLAWLLRRPWATRAAITAAAAWPAVGGRLAHRICTP